MRYTIQFAVAALCLGLACAVDDGATVDSAEQDVVGGVFTITMPPAAFPLNAVGMLDTGEISVIDGSSWLSAAVSLHCPASASVLLCARSFDPTFQTYTSTNWCTSILLCNGDTTFSLPISAFTADPHHALGISILRGDASATVNSATLMEFTPGD